MKYLIKKTYDTSVDQDGLTQRVEKNISDWVVGPQTTALSRRRGDYLLVGGLETDYPKIDQGEDGNYIIIEDAVGKTAGEAVKTFEGEVSQKIKRMDFGKRVLAIIVNENEKKSLSKAQRRALKTEFKDIRESLQDGSIKDAKADIEAITADGTVIKQADIDLVLNEINENLEGLGYA